MGQTLRGRIHRTGKLCVHQQWQTSPRNMRQSRSQIFLADHGEAIDPGMNQKALESQHPGGRERFDVTPGCL